jgi:phage N-6-adenine-methyltransferase
MNPALHSTERMDWRTPRALFDALQGVFGRFDLDPCTDESNPLRTKRFYTERDDGLARPWSGLVFANPPYGRALPTWIAKARDEARRSRATVVCLVPARTDTRWWSVCREAGEITYLEGRVRFELPDGSLADPAPFPSAIVVFRPRLPGSMAVPRG